jgi:hypothetical protein
MKKILFIFSFIFALIASLGSAFAESGKCGDNLTWNLKNGVLTISGTGPMEDIVYLRLSGQSSAPWFYDRASITSINIKEGVTSISKYAFYDCDGLISVTIPNSVISIGERAFCSCNELRSIIIPNGVTSIEDCTFESCKKLSSVIIGNGVARIGNKAFYECSSLTSITIPNSVEVIEDRAFSSCENLSSVTISNKITSIGEGTFSECSSLKSVTIPNSVTSIGDHAFSYCKSLKSVTIPNSVKSIGDGAFLRCESLTSVSIPNSVTAIGEEAFGSTGITSPVYNTHVFAYMPTNYSGAYTIPYGIETIADGAFELCERLTSVTIPNSVTRIGNSAFSGCISLTSISIPDGVTFIGNNAFGGCHNLLSITIPNSLTDVEGCPFNECFSLTSPVYNNHLFVCMPSKYSGDYTIPDGIKTITDGAFAYCEYLTSITIPNSVEIIGNAAFYSCSNLRYVSIPNSVTSIGDRAFIACMNLASITIPNSVTSIGGEIFEQCFNLNSPIYNDRTFVYLPRNYIGAYSIPKGIETITGAAFAHCDGLTSVSIPNSVTSIGNSAFESCEDLTSVTIPNSVTSIGDRAFMGCPNLTSMTIPNSVNKIGNSTFEDCSGLTSVTIPNSVTSIGNYAFEGCTGLTSITIPNSVESIGNHAFYECSGLTSVTCYPIKPLKLGEGPLFGDDFSEITFYVPIGYSEMYNNEELGRFHNVQEIYVKPAILLSSELDAINAQIASIGQQHNELISHSPYAQYLTTNERNLYMHPGSPAQIPDSYDFNQAKAFCDTLQRRLNAMRHVDPVAMVKRHLRTTRPDDFVAAYFQEYPAEKEHLGGEYKEYRCHYPTLTDFVIQYEQGRLQLSERNCRETRWAECADYYASRELFDIDFNQGDSIINEYRSRIDQAWSTIQNFPEKVLKKNLQGASEESKEDVVSLLQLYHQLDPSPHFQLMAVDFLLSNNKKMGKEYEKNGAYFSSKIDFIAAYFSADYKQILKSKK